jgi:hypothetical protein
VSQNTQRSTCAYVSDRVDKTWAPAVTKTFEKKKALCFTTETHTFTDSK